MLSRQGHWRELQRRQGVLNIQLLVVWRVRQSCGLA